jgi:hypothetical protein
MEMVGKMLGIAATADAELAGHLIENALEDCVSTFDGFGRELCRVHAKKSADALKVDKMSFQNLEGAKQNMSRLFNLDLAAGLTDNEWKAAIQGFQKRHLLSHKLGVYDDEYVRKTGDVQAIVGRKASIEADEVREIVRVMGKLARYLASHFADAGRYGEIQP